MFPKLLKYASTIIWTHYVTARFQKQNKYKITLRYFIKFVIRMLHGKYGDNRRPCQGNAIYIKYAKIIQNDLNLNKYKL